MGGGRRGGRTLLGEGIVGAKPRVDMSVMQYSTLSCHRKRVGCPSQLFSKAELELNWRASYFLKMARKMSSRLHGLGVYMQSFGFSLGVSYQRPLDGTSFRSSCGRGCCLRCGCLAAGWRLVGGWLLESRVDHRASLGRRAPCSHGGPRPSRQASMP